MTTSAPIISFSHAGIFVRDLPGMLAFYHHVLGLSITDRGLLEGSEIVFLSANPSEHHQIVLATGRPLEAHFNTVNQLSFRLRSLADLRRMLHVLRDANVDDIRPTSHGIALSIYVKDPEGNRIEFFIDTPWHCEQPLRAAIDLERADDEIWREVEESVRDLPGYVSAEARHAEMVSLMSSGR